MAKKKFKKSDCKPDFLENCPDDPDDVHAVLHYMFAEYEAWGDEVWKAFKEIEKAFPNMKLTSTGVGRPPPPPWGE